MAPSIAPTDHETRREDAHPLSTVDVLRRSLTALRDTPSVIVLFVVLVSIRIALSRTAVDPTLVDAPLSLVGHLVAVDLLARTIRSEPFGTITSFTGRLVYAVVALLLMAVLVAVGLVILSVLGVIVRRIVPAGTVLMTIVGVFFYIRLYAALPAIVVDGHGPVAGLRRSWNHVSGRTVTVGAVVLIVTVVLVLFEAIVFLVAAGGVEPAIEQGTILFDDGLATALERVERGATREIRIATTASAFLGSLLHAATSTVVYLFTED